jgi:DNA-binding NtrC family response regulator
MKILYVENHLVFATQVASRFLSTHAETIVPSLSEARRILSVEKFGLVLVDYDLDDGKGAELVSEIQKLFPTLPTIGVSSHQEGNQAKLKEGTKAICAKMDMDRIETIIEHIIFVRDFPNA